MDLRKKLVVLVQIFVTFSSTAYGLNLSNLRGESRKTYRTPEGTSELCVVPKKWPGGKYSRTDLSKEADLCDYDFYSNVGLCPKLTSTNPAVLLIKPNAKYSKSQIDKSDCNLKSMKLNTDAKFKQSVTCSYTPSILSYYQISRILGNIGRVPVAVLRTMDIKTHSGLSRKALSILKDPKHPTRLSWQKFLQIHENPRFFPNVVDESSTQIFGALSDNVKHEEQYVDVSGVGDYATRYQRFLRQKPFQRVSSPLRVEQIVGSAKFANVAQTVVQMKDVADMVLLDTLLNQQDRIGNIHYKFYWYHINPQTNELERTKSHAKWSGGVIKVPDEESRFMEGRQAALLKEMILKDNDCGITKGNMMAEVGALQKVRHFSYNTYRRFLNFAQNLNTAESKAYFKEEMLFSNADFATLLANVNMAQKTLLGRCQSGDLIFDVDIENYVPGATHPNISCTL